MTASPPCVLTIAGSDPSGGAGIQADLRVFAALGVVGLSAITAFTVQNSQGVHAVHPVPGDVLSQQIEALLQDSAVHAVKIGMLAGAEQVHAVAEVLRCYRPSNIVLDPVLTSTGGVPLLDEAGYDALLTELLPLCDLITPNLRELEAVKDVPEGDRPLRFRAARVLLTRGARAVLIKGGHLPGKPVDVLVREHFVGPRFAADRVDTVHTHGTGCALSSAIAAYLALGFPLVGAISAAKKLLTRALKTPIVVGRGRGYSDVLTAARIGENWIGGDPTDRHQQRAWKLKDALYVITDSELRPDRSAEEIARQAFDGGARVVQLREKRLATPQLILLAKRLVGLARDAGALLIVNDRVDVALAADADGVHLGPDDMHPEDARRLLGADKLIGVSAGTVEEAISLAPFASYLGVGAVFGSKTKSDAGEPIGPQRIREIRSALGDKPIPIVAIGGINADNIAEVRNAGADSAAVVSAVVCAADMRAATKDLLARFRGKWG